VYQRGLERAGLDFEQRGAEAASGEPELLGVGEQRIIEEQRKVEAQIRSAIRKHLAEQWARDVSGAPRLRSSYTGGRLRTRSSNSSGIGERSR
jgi:hypothetical protein